jgi:8-oxo-dGTP diphosphatase
MPEKIDFKCAASTASVIITDSTGLFLVKRKRDPFKGCWALPGGFHKCDEEIIEETAIREVKEETSLDILKEGLAIVCVHSDPKRDPRGHVIDHVFIATEYTGKAQANDDAAEIEFFMFYDLPELAFDHKIAIDTFLKHYGLFRKFAEKIKK